jgi:hypothetical protein
VRKTPARTKQTARSGIDSTQEQYTQRAGTGPADWLPTQPDTRASAEDASGKFWQQTLIQIKSPVFCSSPAPENYAWMLFFPATA